MKCNEAPVFGFAAHNHLVKFPMESSVLDVHVVLVGPEPVDFLVRGAATDHALCGCYPLPDCISPVFDPDMASEKGMIMVGNVAGGKDILDARPTKLIHDDAVIELHFGVADNVRHWF